MWREDSHGIVVPGGSNDLRNFPGVVLCSAGFSRLPDGAAGEDEPLLHQMYKVQQPQGTLNC